MNIWLFVAGWAVCVVSGLILKAAFLGKLTYGLQRLLASIVMGWGLRKTGLDRPGVHKVTKVFGYDTTKQEVSTEDMRELLPSKRGEIVGYIGYAGMVVGFVMAVAGMFGYGT